MSGLARFLEYNVLNSLLTKAYQFGGIDYLSLTRKKNTRDNLNGEDINFLKKDILQRWITDGFEKNFDFD